MTQEQTNTSTTQGPQNTPTTTTTKKDYKEIYRNGFFLAPMVRVGTLPMRLLSLDFGADLVWGPEIIDKSIIGTTRVYDAKHGLIRYIKKGGQKSIFECHVSEKDRLIFQLGTANPDLALQAAKLVQNDVRGVDLNCGCPKAFSVHAGMGAALLSEPDKLCSILENLIQNLDIPVSCKIRMLPEQAPTIELVKKIGAVKGLQALTIHCRTRDMRSREKAMWHRLRELVDCVPHLPVVLNGDIFEYEDMAKAIEETGATSVMTARGAQSNPSLFRKEGKLDTLEVQRMYVKKAVSVDNLYANTKYTILQMYEDEDTKTELYRSLTNSKTYKDLCKVLGLEEYYEKEALKIFEGYGSEDRVLSKKEKKRKYLNGLDGQEITSGGHSVKDNSCGVESGNGQSHGQGGCDKETECKKVRAST
ncbi:tRNA-dihydrouridine synthase 2 [Mycoemilia scoparia]|uniref:tRNA-dihydrouridine synthase 2 n=1 Tax=Mycoemilia scoparia TaxID=417184 RepID=A0A9W8DPQ3_9FUNG|nr:tRNA-dihydrouridine synthase 2 [Mycoemilia scoparia]